MTTTAQETPDHGKPPTDNQRLLSLPERLAINYAGIVEELTNELNSARAQPAKLASDADDMAAADAVVRFGSIMRRAKNLKASEKEPHITANGIIEGFFSDITGRAERAQAILLSRSTTYKTAKETAARLAAADETRRQEAEAAKLAKKRDDALAKGKEGIADKHGAGSIAAMQLAEAAARTATAKPAELTRIKSAGSTSTLVTTYDFSITNAKLIPLEELRPYIGVDIVRKAVASYVRANKDTRPLPGVTITESRKAAVRR